MNGTDTTENGAVTTPVPQLRANANVRFGSRDNQVLRLDVAESLLTAFAEKQPILFGSYLSHALLGTDVKTRGA